MALMPMPFANPTTYEGHGGIDFGKGSGTAIPAITDGVITYSGWWNDNAGYTKTITRADGLKIMYCHLVNLNGAGVGARVSTGQTVGYVGSTGRSTGPHLHLEMWLNGVAQDEWRWMDRNRVVGQGGGSSVGGDWNDTQRQQFLTSIGLDTGGVGNGWGPKSAAATKTFQQWVGLLDDSLFGADTIKVAKQIQAGGKFVTRPTSEIQQFLTSQGIGVGPIDNEWGPKASLGTYIYQRRVGLVPDAQWGTATDAKAFPPKPPETKYPTDGYNAIPGKRRTSDVQKKLIEKGHDLGPAGPDDDYGPLTSIAVAKEQEAAGLVVDGIYGDKTDAVLFPVDPNVPEEPEQPGTEADFTPNMVTPTAADFPSWIRYEEVIDPQSLKPTLNKDAYYYYGKKRYEPIESHTHWWNTPDQGGTHDGNVSYIKGKNDVSVNYVTSAGRITLMVPLNKIAATTGSRNPYAWKTENDPKITISESDLGYKTLGFLHYLVEKLNPKLLNEPIRLHKEFMSTSCSNIDTAKVRHFAEAFRTGGLDPATGLPPVKPEPEPEPEPDFEAVKAEINEHLEAVKVLVEQLAPVPTAAPLEMSRRAFRALSSEAQSRLVAIKGEDIMKTENVTTDAHGFVTSTPQPKVLAATAGAGVGAAISTIAIYLIETLGRVDLPDVVEGAALTLVSAGVAFLAGYIKKPSGVS